MLIIQLILYCLIFTCIVKTAVIGGAVNGLYFFLSQAGAGSRH